VPIESSILERIAHKETLTKKGRLQRWQDLEGSYRIGKSFAEIGQKRILIVDDVITTGATFETIGSLFAGTSAHISFAALAAAV
jgi:predicted amidophosphoribosyltransferase